MEMTLIVQGKDDPPQLLNLSQPVVDLSHIPKITFCLIEGGMQTGEPSVMIVSKTEGGSFILHTSLDKFLAGATGMVAAAESRWGWKQPTGYATIMPTDKKTKKALLEAIKKELEEWDDQL